MSGVNRAIIVGHLGKDATLTTTQSGKKIVNFSVATSQSWRDKTTGERQERTQWHRCVVLNDILIEEAQRLKKGSQVYVQGAIETRKWASPDGDKYFTEIVLRFGSDLQLIPKHGSGGDMGQSEHDYDAAERHYNETGREQITDGTDRRPARRPARDFDDDIPF
jgi:single-strand DNA-binding protein